jgi:hypothetical protein
MCCGAAVSILRPSINHRTAAGIARQDKADAESMIRATLQCARYIEKGAPWRLATREGDSGKVDERGDSHSSLSHYCHSPSHYSPSNSDLLTPTHPSLSYSALIATQLSSLLTSPTPTPSRTRVLAK